MVKENPMADVKEETGKTYGHFYVIEKATSYKGSVRWRCRCECGNEKLVVGSYLRNGQVRSCGKCSLTKKKVADDAAFRKAYYRTKDIHFRERGGGDFITYEEFYKLATSDCHYCGSPPSQVRTAKSYKQYNPDHKTAVINGIDRVDSSKNYEPGNCVPCCHVCNQMKSDRDTVDFLSHISKIMKHYGEYHD
jgi:5-methylcytosine-specific restriction endonuclease McrA